MAKITKQILNERGIHNPHNLASAGPEPQVYVHYVPSDSGGMARSARWVVGHVGFPTDPKGHWSDGGNKTFTVYGRDDKEPERLKAIEWTNTRYKITEWETLTFWKLSP